MNGTVLSRYEVEALDEAWMILDRWRNAWNAAEGDFQARPYIEAGNAIIAICEFIKLEEEER